MRGRGGLSYPCAGWCFSGKILESLGFPSAAPGVAIVGDRTAESPRACCRASAVPQARAPGWRIAAQQSSTTALTAQERTLTQQCHYSELSALAPTSRRSLGKGLVFSLFVIKRAHHSTTGEALAPTNTSQVQLGSHIVI